MRNDAWIRHGKSTSYKLVWVRDGKPMHEQPNKETHIVLLLANGAVLELCHTQELSDRVQLARSSKKRDPGKDPSPPPQGSLPKGGREGQKQRKLEMR